MNTPHPRPPRAPQAASPTIDAEDRAIDTDTHVIHTDDREGLDAAAAPADRETPA